MLAPNFPSDCARLGEIQLCLYLSATFTAVLDLTSLSDQEQHRRLHSVVGFQ